MHAAQGLSGGRLTIMTRKLETIRADYYEQHIGPEDSGFDQDETMPFMTSDPKTTRLAVEAEGEILAHCLVTGSVADFHGLQGFMFADDLNADIFRAMQDI